MTRYQRTAIVGCGSIGTLQRKVLRESHVRHFEIVALSDKDADAMAVLAPDPHERLFVDYRELLAWAEIDTVIISTPPREHFQMAVSALAAGKHVFVEKPPALTVEQCIHMRRAAAQAGRVLFMGFHARYNRIVSLARHYLANEVVERCDVVYRENVEHYHPSGSWIFDRDVSGGGVLMDSGVNALSVLAETLPNAFPITVTRAELLRPAGMAVETAGSVSFELASGSRGNIDMDWLSKEPETRQIVYTTSGRVYVLDLVLEQLFRDGVALGIGRGPGAGKVDQYSEYQRMFDDFAEYAASGRSYISTAEVDFVQQAYRIAS